jgi:hypothetical protein
MELLRFLEEFSPQNFANFFTGDESWFYLYNPRNSMWLVSGVPSQHESRGIVELEKL